MQTYIYDAVRTARGKAKPEGGLAAVKPDELVAALSDAITDRVGQFKPEALLLGSVGQVGAQGGNIALVSKFRAKLPDETVAWTINNFCASGLTAIGQASSMVATGQANRVLAGGVEMMSCVPFMADDAHYYVDTTLPERHRYLLVALAADKLAEDLDISRAEMDTAALRSHAQALLGDDNGKNASRIIVNGLNREECAKKMDHESIAALQPAFAALAPQYAQVLGRKVDHRHTIAHAPPMTDGAGLAMVGTYGAIDAPPRAQIVAFAEVGGDPAVSLGAGFAAMDQVLAKSELSLEDMDRIEFMEAFAVTIVKFLRDHPHLEDRVNTSGGHLAKGHPLGASGAILVSTLLDTLDMVQGRYGLVVASGAEGIGSAMIVKRMDEG
ncbi:putative acyltransferase [Pseudovibrio axinellae]|uniref:Putative acyltransferase n=1 Tax=Pseudovibrio axinellae TaxID=989403 RepID=A0A165ZG35_9HYPH|nr:thiolase family protein [Pseudovibrio axinellae]KZL19861.1 putative acyltransferase [Pseudovibrio axinellae]SER38893.1 acetyl-CoA C-acetyltransferase/acetyl-CoA acyltransferase [Pseudovibrio axinellae]